MIFYKFYRVHGTLIKPGVNTTESRFKPTISFKGIDQNIGINKKMKNDDL